MSAVVDLHEKIGVAAARHRGLARLFDELGLDYYCEGDLTIGETLQATGLDTPENLSRLARAAARPAGPMWIDKPLADVIGFIERDYHGVVRSRLFAIALRLAESSAKNKTPRLEALRTAFREFSEELVAHVEREQLTVFPAIIALEEAWADQLQPPPRFEGGMRAATGRLVLEHFAIAQRMRCLKDWHGVVNESGHPALISTMRRLDGLERHIHQFINLENYVVFPRAAALEDSLDDIRRTPCHYSPDSKASTRSTSSLPSATASTGS